MNKKTVKILKTAAMDIYLKMLPPDWMDRIKKGERISLPPSAPGSFLPVKAKTILRRVKSEYLKLNATQRGMLKISNRVTITN